jgi:uncharacterized membrane protein YheB (UPF0754 family)
MSDFLFDWLIPIASGSVIGYLTNWLAIKMLFRPLKEWRVLGIRVPFTPGILPRGRARIAEGLGDVVARELLPPGVVSTRLSDPSLADLAASSLDEIIENVLSRRIADLLSGGDGAERGAEAGRALLSAFRGFLSSEAFARALDDALGVTWATLKKQRIASILSPDTVRELLESSLSDATIEKLVDSFVGATRKKLEAEAESKIAEALPPESIKDAFEPVIEALHPYAVRLLESLVIRREVRAEIERMAEGAIVDTIGRLNAFQRFIVAAARYDEEIIRAVPATVDGLLKESLAMFRSRKFREGLVTTLKGEYDKIGSETVASVVGPAPDAAEAIRGFLKSILLDKKVGSQLARAAADLLGRKPDGTFGDLLESVDESTMASIGEKAGALARTALASDGTGVLAGAFIERFFATLGPMRLGDLLPIGDVDRAVLSRFASSAVLKFAASESERILRGLDLKAIVKERIDSLDMLAVENLLLAIISKELKWITWLGGLLGAMIGAAQGIVSLFR